MFFARPSPLIPSYNYYPEKTLLHKKIFKISLAILFYTVYTFPRNSAPNLPLAVRNFNFIFKEEGLWQKP
jgi:hypothetical protein